MAKFYASDYDSDSVTSENQSLLKFEHREKRDWEEHLLVYSQTVT